MSERMTDTTPDRGVCCFCGGDCNPASQSCGICSRNTVLLGRPTVLPETKIEQVARAIKVKLNTFPVQFNSVVVYDIDGTLLDENGPIQPIVDTYHHARTRGFKTVIVTARIDTVENIGATIGQLANHGIGGYSHIYFLPAQRQNVAKFKLHARQHIHELGMNVVASIGDMPWDIGMWGGDGFLVK